MDSEIPPRFLERLSTFPNGYTYGRYLGRRYGISISRPVKGVVKLYAEELGGTNYVSFNLYLGEMKRHELKPCEMSSAKIIDFILDVELLPHVNSQQSGLITMNQGVPAVR